MFSFFGPEVASAFHSTQWRSVSSRRCNESELGGFSFLWRELQRAEEEQEQLIWAHSEEQTGLLYSIQISEPFTRNALLLVCAFYFRKRFYEAEAILSSNYNNELMHCLFTWYSGRKLVSDSFFFTKKVSLCIQRPPLTIWQSRGLLVRVKQTDQHIFLSSNSLKKLEEHF